MKKQLIVSSAAAVLLLGIPLQAQTTVRESVTTVQPAPATEVVGTVTELVPDAVTVRTEETTAPMRYTFTKTTEYVDEAGNPVGREILRTGVPVTIRYVRQGDQMVVNRVIVRKAVTAPGEITTRKTTTTTTTKEKD